MKLKQFSTLVFTFLALHLTAFAGVNLKNGNFYISYTDLSQISPYTAFKDITRTYNSKATRIGLFGYGWGVEFQTHLYAYPDGTVVIQEHGSGGRTMYTSQFATDDMLEDMIDQIIDAEIEDGALDYNPDAILERRKKLTENAALRSVYWDKYVKKGLLEPFYGMPEGMQWDSFQRGNQRLEKTGFGFERVSGREIEQFDNDGNLILKDNGNGVFTKLEYIENRITKMINADGSEVYFKTNADGFIIELSSSVNDNVSVFKYDGQDLVYSKDVEGNIYGFEYDNHHNLIKIIYNLDRQEGVKEDAMIMEYSPKTYYISKIIDRNGDITEYNYLVFYKEDGSVDDDHYGTEVTKRGFNGQPLKNSYEYFIGVKRDGNRFTQKIKTTINGITTETTYDDLCNVPTLIIRGNRSTAFKYNNRCLLTYKATNYDTITMRYHPKLEKIVYVKNNNGETEFEYSDDGDLTYAKKGDNWVRLIYNENGKISKMEQEKNSLIFTYNDIGKPIKIEMEEVGAIKVEYDKYGEITRVSSDEGSNISLKVTQAFQNLLALVKPAGVNLNM
ncbi:DUF6531 domain-containing protein [Gaetbulibacter aestuarii]|uniref:DUF6531 domain-containing protein n=1 Tax=Gaetbulibacter aestuarii TaxID=1502358 RepID=A0ABW7N1G7_9FLAO